MTVALGKDDNVRRVASAVSLAIHTIARPINTTDEIPRKDIISLNIAKFTSWIEAIDTLINCVRASQPQLESLL